MEKVPPSWACALAFAFRFGPLPPLILVRLWALPSTAAALPPAPIEEPVPAGPVEVPPVPSVEAEVPPAEADPAVPPVALICAKAWPERARAPAVASAMMLIFVMSGPFTASLSRSCSHSP